MIACSFFLGISDAGYCQVTAPADPAGAGATVTPVPPKTIKRLDYLTAEVSVMDDHTAAQLFGKSASRQFYAVRIVLQNRLNEPDVQRKRVESLAKAIATRDLRNTVQAEDITEAEKLVSGSDSILVFSPSIVLPVHLQQYWDGKSDLGATAIGTPSPVAKKWTELETMDQERLVQQANLTPESKSRGFHYKYPPYLTQMIFVTTERRNAENGREKVFERLELFGQLGGFLTAVGALKGSSDLFFNRYSNLLVPGLAKIYPSTSEIHRQNISTFAMKEFEEVPYGSQISRVLFMPRDGITGLLTGRQVRISAIDTSDISVRVAVLDKSQVEQGVVGGNP